MKITRFNHAALHVGSGVEEMERFYTGVLGIPTVPRDIPPEFASRVPGFWMQLDNAQVHVIQAPLAGRPREPMGRHLAFYVEDLEAAVATLAGIGRTCGKQHRGRGNHCKSQDPKRFHD